MKKLLSNWNPFDGVHWRLWRLAIADLAAARRRFFALALSLECQGDPQAKAIARDIKNILCSKH